ncbi:hypothetical protein ACFQ0G_09665 [Streptomyces chiangmaiensis]
MEVSKDVCGWYQGSVEALQWVVLTPSQSMSMSAVQVYAEPFLQICTVDAPPSSVAYLPLDAGVQFCALESSWAALGPAAAAVVTAPAALGAVAPMPTAAAHVAAAMPRAAKRRRKRIRGTVHLFWIVRRQWVWGRPPNR